MVKILIVQKNGDIKISKMNNFDIDLLHKKCGFQNSNNFNLEHTWKHKNYYLSLFAKKNGRAGTENKYDLPPPVDSSLFFGKLKLLLNI